MIEINKIPVEFNAINPMQENNGYIRELGNYTWYLHQYKMFKSIDRASITTKENVRKDLIQYGIKIYIPNGFEKKYAFLPMESFADIDCSKVISYKAFEELLIKVYLGCGPYAEGMPYGKAKKIAGIFVHSFLSCKPEEAIYIKYNYIAKSPYFTEPYIIMSFIGILDLKNGEFFELVIGGTD